LSVIKAHILWLLTKRHKRNMFVKAGKSCVSVMVNNNDGHKCILNTPPAGTAFYIMIIYLDESGDLGWKFDAPVGSGGSSRYLTITFLIIPDSKKHLIKRRIVKAYQKFNFVTTKEYKGCNLTDTQRTFFLNNILSLFQNNAEIKIGAITVNKERVYDYIREDGNIIYNYLIRLGLTPHLYNGLNIKLIRDERSVKVESGNSLIEYLKSIFWFEEGLRVRINDHPTDSKCNKNLLFTDWLCYSIWCKYEFGIEEYFDIIRPHLDSRTFLF